MNWPVVCWSVLVFGIAGAIPASAAGKPPAPGQPLTAAAIDDQWLGEVCLDELRRATAAGECPALAEKIKSALLARLACGRIKSPVLTDMVYALTGCAYLPLAEAVSGERKLGCWLLERRDVSRRLFRALGESKSPKEAVGRLAELIAADEKAVIDYPDLAVAFATATPIRVKQPSAASLVESFQYYTRSKTAFRFDLRKMPYELSRYLANSRLSLAERQWAVAQYRTAANPAGCYFHVPYDYDHFQAGTPKKIANAVYTLANLRAIGGVCVDQAYYASEVCKALGVPAVVVGGRGDTGMRHAWVACLMRTSEGRASWDVTTGRYREQRYFTGLLREPTTDRDILDSELMVLGEAAQLPLAQREEADANIVLARLADAARDTNPRPDQTVLKELARLYSQMSGAAPPRDLAGSAGPSSGPPRPPAKPPARVPTDWIRPSKKIDLAAIEELIDAAIAANLAHPAAWQFIIELRQADRLPVEHLDRFFDVLVGRTADAYPDYSCVLVLGIVPTISDAAKREAVYRKALDIYGKRMKTRPDLRGRILLALGDDFRQQNRKDQALKAYEQAALQCIDLASVVVPAAGRAEELLLEANRPEQAVNMYTRLFAAAKKWAVDTAFRSDTAHYKLGKRLAELLRQAGQERAAKDIEAKL